jgi:hypothetical protein
MRAEKVDAPIRVSDRPWGAVRVAIELSAGIR